MEAQIVIVAAGIALLVLTGWSWWGRGEIARWWVRSLFGRRAMLAVVPGLGVLVLGGGLLTLIQESAASLFDATALLLAVPMLAACVLELAGMVGLLPKWWGPKWYRELIRTEKKPPWIGW